MCHSPTLAQEAAGHALILKAFCLRDLGRTDEAITLVDELVDSLRGRGDDEALRATAHALAFKVAVCCQRSDVDEATVLTNTLLEQFGASDDSVTRQAVIQALYNIGTTLDRSGRDADARQAYEELLDRIGSPTDPSISRLSAWASQRLAVLPHDK